MNTPQIDEAALKKAVQAYLDCKSLSYKMSNAQTQKIEAAITAYLSATRQYNLIMIIARLDALILHVVAIFRKNPKH